MAISCIKQNQITRTVFTHSRSNEEFLRRDYCVRDLWQCFMAELIKECYLGDGEYDHERLIKDMAKEKDIIMEILAEWE